MTHCSRGLRLLPAFALILVLCHPRDAAAANSDSTINSLRDMVSDFFAHLVEPFTERTVDSVTEITPESLVRSMDTKSHFFRHLSDAGYSLAEVDMSIGLIPGVTLTFQMVRELSDADREAAERGLEIDDKRVPGLTAMTQRQIIRTLLAISRSGEMRVGKLVIGVLPLPSAHFTIEPADSPLSEEHSKLLLAIKNMAPEGPGDPHKLKQQK
jgi:hypothetical protein